MKITKSRLKEIIREEIQNFKKEQIVEISAGGYSMGGAKRKGYKSPATKTKQSNYDTSVSNTATKKSAKTTRAADYETKSSALSAYSGNKFRKAHRGSYLYRSSTASGYELNPAWTSRADAKTAALTAKNSADSDYDTAVSDESSALSSLRTSQASDLQATIPTVAPPAGKGAGAGFGKGKAAGKGKGKGGKKGKKKKN